MADNDSMGILWTSWRFIAAACAGLVLALGLFAAVNPAAFDLRGGIFAAGLAFALLAVGVLYAVAAPRATTTATAAPAREPVRASRPAPARETAREAVRAAPETKWEPFGDVHPVIDVEGIGPGIAAKLKKQGIEDTRQLWHADAAQVAKGLGLASPIVRDWQAMAELMAINGLGKQYAEVLVKAGITTIADLRRMDPPDLVKAVEEAGEDLTHRIQGNKVTDKVAANWIEAARAHPA